MLGTFSPVHSLYGLFCTCIQTASGYVSFFFVCVCDREREPPHQHTRNCPRQPKIPAANQHHPLPIPLPRNDTERHLARRTRRLHLIGPKRGAAGVGRIGLEEEADTPWRSRSQRGTWRAPWPAPCTTSPYLVVFLPRQPAAASRRGGESQRGGVFSLLSAVGVTGWVRSPFGWSIPMFGPRKLGSARV
jgi:hypothetical protein